MKRVWKPLDVKGLRLYEVRMAFPGHPEWTKRFIVAAKSPSHAARLIFRIYKDSKWVDDVKPVIRGYALDIYQPESWWTGEDE